MGNLSVTEENYLKAIYKLSLFENNKVSNNAIASLLNINPASVLEMLRRLNKKKLISYDKIKGAKLTPAGKLTAIHTIRKHRLWEVFLHEKLGFGWDEVHAIAEQMEHVQSRELVDRLDKYLGRPKFDPHGDPIPDEHGKFLENGSLILNTALAGKEYAVTGVKDSSESFLKYLNKNGLHLGVRLKVIAIESYDDSLTISIQKKEITLSGKVAENLLVKKI